MSGMSDVRGRGRGGRGQGCLLFLLFCGKTMSNWRNQTCVCSVKRKAVYLHLLRHQYCHLYGFRVHSSVL